MEKGEQEGGEFRDSFQVRGAYLFSVLFAKSHLSFTKHFICLTFKEIGIYNRNVVKKRRFFRVLKKDKSHLLPSKYGHEIFLQNEDLCYFQNSGIDQCCHIWSCFSFQWDYLYVLNCFFFLMFPVNTAMNAVFLLTILHTH